MPALTYEIGATNTTLLRVVADSKRAMKELAASTADYTKRQNAIAKTPGNSILGGQSGHQIGQVAMQAQDVAVSLEMGASSARIIAQQGSQIASAFGPGGMIAGGVLAIGAGMVALATESRNVWKVAQEEFANFDSSMRATIRNGGISEVQSALAEIPEQLKKIGNEQEGLTGLSGFGKSFSFFTGGPSLNERKIAAANAEESTLKNKQQLEQKLLTLTEEQLKVLRLKAEGEEREAEALEDQIKLRTALAQITAKYGGEVGQNLKNMVREEFSLRAQIRETERQKKEEEECTAEAKKHKSELDKQIEAARKVGEEQEALARAQRDQRDATLKAERKLQVVGDTGRARQTQLLEEYSALQASLMAAEAMHLPEAEKIRTAIAENQLELAENALKLNKQNLSEEEKRKNNAEALAAANNAIALAKENQKTGSIQGAVNRRLMTPDQRREADRAERAREGAVRKEIGKRLEQEQAQRQRDRKPAMTDEEKKAFRADQQKQFKGEQPEQLKELQNISSLLGKVAENIGIV